MKRIHVKSRGRVQGFLLKDLPPAAGGEAYLAASRMSTAPPPHPSHRGEARIEHLVDLLDQEPE